MTAKQTLRQLIRLRKQQPHPADESVAVLDRLRQDKHFLHARTLLLYNALPDEVQTQPLLDSLVAEGKTVLLPRVVSAIDMVVCRYTGRNDLAAGPYGILEPTGSIFTDYQQIEVAVIPGVAFDVEGHRLGRGRGYYDRFLSLLSPKVYKIGLCFPWQLVNAVPTDDNDIPMDLVIY